MVSQESRPGFILLGLFVSLCPRPKGQEHCTISSTFRIINKYTPHIPLYMFTNSYIVVSMYNNDEPNDTIFLDRRQKDTIKKIRLLYRFL